MKNYGEIAMAVSLSILLGLVVVSSVMSGSSSTMVIVSVIMFALSVKLIGITWKEKAD